MEIHHKIEVIMKEDDINKAWGVTDLLTQRCTTQINRLLSVFEDFQRLTTVGDTRFTFRDTQEIGVPPGWLGFIGDTKIYTEELKTLDAYKVLLENVVVEPGDQWAHYQAVAAAVHLEMMSIYVQKMNDSGMTAAAALLRADVPLPAPLIDVAAAHGAECHGRCDPLALKLVMVLTREEYLMANAPDVCGTAPCAICGQLFDGPARIRHLRELGPCRDAIISYIDEGEVFYCDGSCNKPNCKRMEHQYPKWPFLSAGACERHKGGHDNGTQHEIRLCYIKMWEACNVECICPSAENGHQMCHKPSCPLNLFACEVRDKIKKERPPCTCNKSYHQHDCKWTCPKLQFMIQNKFYRKDNPGGFHGYPEALAAKRRRFENEARVAETDVGYDSDGSEALVCVPVRSGTANF